MTKRFVTLDGNEAAAYVAHRCSEVMAIYPITPSSTLGEWADEWAAKGVPNIFGTVPHVMEMQSEAGAAGAVHGSLQGGALTSTFTASQGLLLMIPNMFKIAGELTPAVFHVTARAVATHALSIFGDHSDVMACRSTGWAMLASGSVQEAQDMAMIAHAATLKARVPFLHYYDGFRISHEINTIDQMTEDEIRQMIPMEQVEAFRARALNPNKPVIRGTAQNPDVFFQAREAGNRFYNAVPEVTQEVMNDFAKVTGRQYHLFDYIGAPDAEHVVVAMCSGCGVVGEAVQRLVAEGEKVGVLAVRLYRPFDAKAFVDVIPASCKRISVLDRTKEPGALGEPLYQDVVTALAETGRAKIEVFGGRYGLSSKEFTPAMAKAVFDDLKNPAPKKHFTVGIEDDVTNLSLPYDSSWSTEAADVTRALFYGLGSDGTVGANKNSVKIVSNYTTLSAQGYFEYDSKKAGSITKSHLRFSPRPILGSYLVSSANFIACHQWEFINQIDMLASAEKGATFLINCPYGPEEMWDHLPRSVQQDIIAKEIRVWVVDANAVAAATGMGRRTNTILQACFFALGKVGGMSSEEAIGHIKEYIKKSYSRKGEDVVQKNYAAVDASLDGLKEVQVPGKVTSTFERRPGVIGEADAFVTNVLGTIMEGNGNSLKVSDFATVSPDGTFPTGTTQYEKRCIALNVPIWDPDVCLQCGMCSLVCPHAAIRMKIYEPELLASAPESFRSTDCKAKEFPGTKFTVQVYPEDCTGCGLCVNVCPGKNKQEEGKKAINMTPILDVIDEEKPNQAFFHNLPDMERSKVNPKTIKGSQLLLPLFEFSGACAGCGETPYIKLITQLFGDRMMIGNATGCSSIYGGNLPSTPYCKNAEGRGPAWSNSLFEDNAEFALGMRLAADQQKQYISEKIEACKDKIGAELVDALLTNPQNTEEEISTQRANVAKLNEILAACDCEKAKSLIESTTYLIRRSVWAFGGDGWAYDIGYGGLDHVMASGKNVNVLVLDTEVYSNTGGQASKSTPRGSVAKFAAGGKRSRKKDLGLMAASYGNVYVGQIALGANPMHAIKVIAEAEAHNGPSLIIAYSHCINHGIDMVKGLELQKEAVACGYWPLYHYDPSLKTPFVLDSKEPKGTFQEFASKQNRYNSLKLMNPPEEVAQLLAEGQEDITDRFHYYQQLSKVERDPEQE
ncbi:MAG: pyruvate:ferredoxin (flavodoxin) oxidoreductase [Planctomycetia bacterium]|nr:pyruvate:ferredoxin (flavodoxin) oxidoreductase [Planctomycetia bacterium]